MPISVDADVRVLGQKEFGRIAFDVMNHVFAIHNEMGRFLDEGLYRDSIAARVGEDARTEVAIEVTFEDFRKDYAMDLLVSDGAVFELKAVKRLASMHRAQILNYLLLCGLAHGKLVNMRGEQVEHEFVNTQQALVDRTAFEVLDVEWKNPYGHRPFQDWMLGFLREVGTGLDIQLYRAAIRHFFGGNEEVDGEIDVLLDGRRVGRQKVMLLEPRWACETTTIGASGVDRFEDHLRRFLTHTDLDGIHWINITRELVAFQSIQNS